jgi:DNA-binding transcriptional LysR family regulator
MGVKMELRHLRYFVAVAEAGSLTVAAEQKLHTSQPSLSRQIRDLEENVGAQLLTRRARGIDLTPAGLAFSITPAQSCRRLMRQLKPRAGSLILPSHASPWVF